MFIIILLLLLSMPVGRAEHSQTFLEFEAHERMMQLQLNLWELFDQLQYAQGELRVRVLEEIHQIQTLINEQIIVIIELDHKHHGK